MRAYLAGLLVLLVLTPGCSDDGTPSSDSGVDDQGTLDLGGVDRSPDVKKPDLKAAPDKMPTADLPGADLPKAPDLMVKFDLNYPQDIQQKKDLLVKFDQLINPDLPVMPDLIVMPDIPMIPDLPVVPDLPTQFDLPPQPDLPVAPDGPVPPDSSPPADQGITCTSDLDCNDKIACTLDSCLKGFCSFKVNANFCLIAGACITIDTLNPSDSCQKCQPTIDAYAYSKYVCTKTVAGNGKNGTTDGSLSIAQFYSPTGIAVGPSGEVYVADQNNNRIRMIFASKVTTLAGSGTYGYLDGTAATAQFRNPTGVAVGPLGEVYVADENNHVIRKIQSGQVTTVAGNTKAGFTDGLASSARFYYPHGVAVGPSGEVYVADNYNHRIRWIVGGQVMTLAGSGTAGFLDGAAATARFQYPRGIALGPKGEVYVGDHHNNRIRKILNSQVTTEAGSGTYGFANGSASAAQFRYPNGLAVGSAGEIYVADENNHAIRLISGGKVSTLAGTGGTNGFADSPATYVYFHTPYGVAYQKSNTVYVGDRGNHRVRVIRW